MELNTLEICYGRSKSEWLIDKSKYFELLDPIDYDTDEREEAIDPEIELAKNRSKVDLSSNCKKIEAEDIDTEF